MPDAGSWILEGMKNEILRLHPTRDQQPEASIAFHVGSRRGTLQELRLPPSAASGVASRFCPPGKPKSEVNLSAKNANLFLRESLLPHEFVDSEHPFGGGHCGFQEPRYISLNDLFAFRLP